MLIMSIKTGALGFVADDNELCRFFKIFNTFNHYLIPQNKMLPHHEKFTEINRMYQQCLII